MSKPQEKYLVSGMSTVLIISFEGKNVNDPIEIEKIDKRVEKKVKEIVDGLKVSHGKFEDPDFGPNEKDEFGAKSLYGGMQPEPAGSKYPAPETLRWERPQYNDDKFASDEEGGDDDEDDDEDGDEEDEEEDEFSFGGGRSSNQMEIFCKKGRLFIDGTSSGDVIQGQLGDCWFLSALAVLGADDVLLEKCFWRRDEFREFGLYVLRFFKDCSIFFVMIDDRLPVKAKDGRLIFAGGKDPNELWVPLIEKAYAKLHGCYKSLIGGYTHYGLADMTGYCPHLVVMREGYLGYSQSYTPDEIWQMLTRYTAWKSLLGCSIQSPPNEKKKIEAEAGQGLHMGHAYSFLQLGEIQIADPKRPGQTKGLRLVKLRNPWGRGEWEGAFADSSPERKQYDAEFVRVFNTSVRSQERAEINETDGTFFMPFDDWLKHFTSLFIAINFPNSIPSNSRKNSKLLKDVLSVGGAIARPLSTSWCGKRTGGLWSGEQGGNRSMGTWITNPKFKFRLEPEADAENASAGGRFVEVFVGLYIKDSRLTMGFDYYKDPLYATPMTFDIVTAAQLHNATNATEEYIPNAWRTSTPPPASSMAPAADTYRCKQPPYNFGAAQVQCFLQTGVDYYIIPSLYKRNQSGAFFLTVYANTTRDFYLDGGASVAAAIHKPMEVGPADSKRALKMSVAQFNEKKEILRDRIVSEAKRLHISMVQLEALMFNGAQKEVPRSVFKRRMMDAGFMLTDFPDDDFVVLDEERGVINIADFLAFARAGMQFVEGKATAAPAPEKPVDDLLFKTIDLSGEVCVQLGSARGLRDASAWFKNLSSSSASPALALEGGGGSGTAVRAKTLISYDIVQAQEARKRAAKQRLLVTPRHSANQSASGRQQSLQGDYPTTGAALTASALHLNTNSANANTNANTLSLDLNSLYDSAVSSPDKKPLPSQQQLAKALQSINTTNNNNISNNNKGPRAMTVHSQMSMTQRDLVTQAGTSAAAKLHSDATLQRAEVQRTQALSALRYAQRNSNVNNKNSNATTNANTAAFTAGENGYKGGGGGGGSANGGLEDDTVLRGRRGGATNLRRDRRNIYRDTETMLFLGLSLDAASTAVARTGAGDGIQQNGAVGLRAGMTLEKPPVTASATNASAHTAGGAVPPIGRASSPPLLKQSITHHTTNHTPNMRPTPVRENRPPDLWDLLIDKVHTICAARPQNARTLRHAAFVACKRKPMTTQTLQRLETQSDTPFLLLPSQQQSQQGNAAGGGNSRGKYVSGTKRIATPRAPKAPSRGVASVSSASASRQQTKQTLLDAKQKLEHLQQTQGTTYEEVYRRLCVIPTTSYEEISGDRHSQSRSNATTPLSADSTAYLRKLFEKFDSNANGLISKEEFRLAMHDMHVDLSAEECDIFFNRFTGVVPNNIAWKEFVQFFQQEIAGATMKASTSTSYTPSYTPGTAPPSSSSTTTSNPTSSSAAAASSSSAYSTPSNIASGLGAKAGMDHNLVAVLIEMKSTLRVVIQEMRRQKITSIDAYLEAQTHGPSANAVATVAAAKSLSNQAKAVDATKKPTRNDPPSLLSRNNLNHNNNSSASYVETKLSPNALFQTLSLAQAKANAQNLQALGLSGVSELMMKRLSRVFDYSVTSIMDFLLDQHQEGGGNVDGGDFAQVLNLFDEEVSRELLARGGTVHVSSQSPQQLLQQQPQPQLKSSSQTSSRAVLTPAKTSSANMMTPISSNNNNKQFSLNLNHINSPTVPAVLMSDPLSGSGSSLGSGLLADIPTSTTAKIWSCFAPNLDALASFDTLVQYLFSLLQESTVFQERQIPLTSPRAINDPLVQSLERKASATSTTLSLMQSNANIVNGINSPATPYGSSGGGGNAPGGVHLGRKLFFNGVDVSVLLRIVVDAMMYSSWNRASAATSLSSASSASASSTSTAVGGGVSSKAINIPAVSSASSSSSASAASSGVSGTTSSATSTSSAAALAASTAGLVQYLSFSGLDAYVRNTRVSCIERKLQYLLHLEHDRTQSFAYYLVHVYVSQRGDEVVILADDPLSGEVYTLRVQEDVSHLPRGEDLKRLFLENKHLAKALAMATSMSNYPSTKSTATSFDLDALYLYNPVDMPFEDAAITKMLQRLKLVRTYATNAARLILGEDPQFVQQLKTLLDASAKALPFFYLVNDLCVSFEVDQGTMDQLANGNSTNNNGAMGSNALVKSGTNASSASSTALSTSGANAGGGHRASVRAIVFESIRRQKTLCAFLTQVHASLQVVLSTYNSTQRETLVWDEMLAHLCNQRNPFVTLQLLPRYIPPAKYLYEPPDDQGGPQNSKTKAFTGDDDEDDEDEDEDEDDEHGGQGVVAKTSSSNWRPRHRAWQRSHVDFDGAPRPCWDTSFAFHFHAPKMLTCEVHAREVVRMKVDNVWKYVMVLIREGQRVRRNPSEPTGSGRGGEKEAFLFLTIYDPRSATEYMCGVKAHSALYEQLFYDRYPFPTSASPSTTSVTNAKTIGTSTNTGSKPPASLTPQQIDARRADLWNHRLDVERIRDLLQVAVERDEVYVGPGITPRLELSVMNYKDDKSIECLGTSQVSIATVLSGSGVSDKMWVKLLHRVEQQSSNSNNTPLTTASTNAGMSGTTSGVSGLGGAQGGGPGVSAEVRTMEIDAGEIEVELRFRRSVEMEGAWQAARDRQLQQQDRKKVGGGSGGNRSARRILPRGDEETPVESSGSVSGASAQKQVKELQSKLVAKDEELQRALAAYQKLKGGVVGGGVGDKKADDEAEFEGEQQKLREDVQRLEQERRRLLEDKEKVQREYAAAMHTLGTVQEELEQKKKKETNREVSPRSAGASSSRAEVDVLAQQNEALREQERQTKRQVEEMKAQLQRMKEEHAKTVEEMHKLKESNTNHHPASTASNATAKASSTATAAATATAIANSVGNAEAGNAMDLAQVLQLLTARYERKMKVTGVSSIAPITAPAVLDTLQRLLHSYATPEGMITQRELLIAFHELMIEVNTEFVVKIVAQVGPDARKMVQVHSVMDHLKHELAHMLKQQQKKLRGSVDLRTSQEGPAALGGGGATNDSTASLEQQKKKVRPSSAVVQGSGKAAVAAINSTQTEGKKANSKPSVAVPLKSQSVRDMAAGAMAESKDAPKSDVPAEKPSATLDPKDPEYWVHQPLPPKWERKFHEPAKRYVYIDHEHQKTQWHHPLDPSGSSSASGRSGGAAQTQPVKPTSSRGAGSGPERLSRTVEIPSVSNMSSATADKLNSTFSGTSSSMKNVSENDNDDDDDDHMER